MEHSRGQNWRSQFVVNTTGGGLFNEQTREEEALRSIFNEDVIALTSLRRMALRNGLPSARRTIAWKLLLGLIPPVQAAWKTAEAALKQGYDDLRQVASAISQSMEASSVRSLVQVYAVYSGISEGSSLASTAAGLSSLLEDRRLLAMATVVSSVFGDADQAGAFWALTEIVKSQRVVAMSKYGERRLQSWGIRHRLSLLDEMLLAKEENLVEKLGAIGIFTEKYAATWFRSYFAESLELALIPPIWDRVVAAPGDIIAHVAVAMIHALKTLGLNQAINTQNQVLVLDFLRRPVSLPHAEWKLILARVAAESEALIEDERNHNDTIFTFDIEWPTVVKGDKNHIVKCLQYLLRAHGFGGYFFVDSVFGRRTEQALERLRCQLAERRAAQVLKPTASSSSLGASPLENLLADSYSSASGIRPSAASLEVGPVLDKEWTAGATLWPHLVQNISRNAQGDVVRALQHLLLHQHGYKNVRVDGYFGSQCDSSVRHFQQHLASRMIPVDGRVGRITWMHLLASDHYSRRDMQPTQLT